MNCLAAAIFAFGPTRSSASLMLARTSAFLLFSASFNGAAPAFPIRPSASAAYQRA